MKPFALSTALLAAVLSSPLARADRLAGPGVAQTRVEAHSQIRFTELFAAGKEAVVIVRGDGDTDLDLFVYDENGNLIAQDTDSSDVCVVRWTPRWSGRFHIVVKNLGNVYNAFTIATN